MKRILGTTAIILSLTGPAFADAHAAGFGTVTAQETDFFASDLIGMRIYNSETEVEANSTIAADGRGGGGGADAGCRCGHANRRL